MAGGARVTRRARAGWLVGYAGVTFLSFPHPVGGSVLDLGAFASWLGPACLLLGLRGLAPGAAARAAFAAGLVAHAAIFHWIQIVTVTYGHAPALVGPLAVLLLALYPAAFVAAFGAGAALLARAGGPAAAPSPWLAAALWAALDHGRSFVLTGFPWAVLGYAQHRNPALLALAPWTGVVGLSFVVALGGAALADALASRAAGGPALPRRAAAALAAVVLVHAAGALDVAREPGDTGLPRLRVAVAQGNIDQGVKWSPEWGERTLAIYEDLTRRAAADGAQVVLWPETAVPGSPDALPALADRLAALARETGAALVVGALGFEQTPAQRRFWDSAFVWSPDGRFVGRYDKAHLVPFGEYVPMRDLLGHFVEAVARGTADTDVSRGSGPRAMAIPLAPGAGRDGGVTAGVPICYELLFPDLVRRFAADGAEALFAITNDAWYGRTGAPYQFLAITALRAAESRLWTARAANTGVSALIDHRGRVRERTDIFERDVRVGDIVLRPPPHGGSFYVRHGEWFARTCGAVAAIALLAAARRARTAARTARRNAA